MLKSRGSVHCPRVPQFGQTISARPPSGARPFFSSNSSIIWSSRNRLWQCRHSVSGSVKTPTWPDATHTWRGRITDESRPTTSSRLVTIARHHCFLMFSLSSVPRGP
ncbi:Uncharacterised protein [Mycobacteroides abscessus]|nr:Uncharacterised protein [Mycobacteroides abscessus]